MKRLFYILTGVVILYLSSIIYIEKTTSIMTHFPVERLAGGQKDDALFSLILYFSMNNCPPCMKVIDFLNEPPEGIRAVGIVPEREAHLIDEVRQTTGATFPIYSLAKWKRYDPIYAPTLYGVGPDGNIYIVLPCVGLEESYLPWYLAEFLRKAKAFFRAPGQGRQ